LSTIKCKEFVSSGKDNIAIIITWLDGYYKEKDDPPISSTSLNSARTRRSWENIAATTPMTG
jgi:acid stress chaperone HdeB